MEGIRGEHPLQTKSMIFVVWSVPKLAGFNGDLERILLFFADTFDIGSPNIRRFSCSISSPAIDELDCDVLTIFCNFSMFSVRILRAQFHSVNKTLTSNVS